MILFPGDAQMTFVTESKDIIANVTSGSQCPHPRCYGGVKGEVKRMEGSSQAPALVGGETCFLCGLLQQAAPRSTMPCGFSGTPALRITAQCHHKTLTWWISMPVYQLVLSVVVAMYLTSPPVHQKEGDLNICMSSSVWGFLNSPWLSIGVQMHTYKENQTQSQKSRF